MSGTANIEEQSTCYSVRPEANEGYQRCLKFPARLGWAEKEDSKSLATGQFKSTLSSLHIELGIT